MQIKSVGAALALAMLSTTAFAADLPSRRAPVVVPPPPIPFSWTGGYIGAQIGYEFGKDDAFARSNVTGVGVASNGARPEGVIGGAHIGYNFSTQSIPFFGNAFGSLVSGTNGFGIGAFGFGTPGAVIGIEGDVDGTSARANYLLGGIATRYKEDIQGSVRGRLGIAVDRVLFYATGGVAFASLENRYATALAVQTVDRTRVGYTVGGGIEYAFEGPYSFRVEYRYTDFGSYTDTLGVGAGNVNVRHRDTDQRVQAGLSYKFQSPVAAPIVARY